MKALAYLRRRGAREGNGDSQSGEEGYEAHIRIRGQHPIQMGEQHAGYEDVSGSR